MKIQLDCHTESIFDTKHNETNETEGNRIVRSSIICMGMICSTHERCEKFIQSYNLKRRQHLEDLGEDGIPFIHVS